MKNKNFSLLLTVLAATLFALALSEVLLRLSGKKPWSDYTIDTNEPRVFEYDDVLGWRNKQGHYTMPGYSPGADPTEMTILENGSRITGEQEKDQQKKFVILGGSFTLGWAISDTDTYPWKLQEKYPEFNVMNFGCNGYGTYQSLLVLENEFSNGSPPAIVLYSFMGHHEERNVAPPEWMAALSKLSNRRQKVALPYCTIDLAGQLVRHPPESYPVWPFRQSLALVPLVQKVSQLPTSRSRHRQKVAVTERLLLEMQEWTELHGSDFAVALLEASDAERAHYSDFLHRNEIKVIDCIHPMPPEMHVEGEGHPNGNMNTVWAECIARGLAAQQN
jgi:hypothetical protein